MKLLNFLKNITRLIGGVNINSTSSPEEASHLMTTLGGFSPVTIEDDDLNDAQKITAFNEILKYNKKALNIGVLPPNSFLSLQEMYTYFDNEVVADTIVTPVVTLKSLGMRAKDAESADVWEIPRLLTPAAQSGVLVPGVSIDGNMIRTYAPIHLSSVSGEYNIDVAEINLSADLLFDITDLESDKAYNVYMFYRFQFGSAEYGSLYRGCMTIAEGISASDLVEDGHYSLSAIIDDASLVTSFDTPTVDGFEDVSVYLYFVITDSEGIIMGGH